jgi:hypothetical protein
MVACCADVEAALVAVVATDDGLCFGASTRAAVLSEPVVVWARSPTNISISSYVTRLPSNKVPVLACGGVVVQLLNIQTQQQYYSQIKSMCFV